MRYAVASALIAAILFVVIFFALAALLEKGMVDLISWPFTREP